MLDLYLILFLKFSRNNLEFNIRSYYFLFFYFRDECSSKSKNLFSSFSSNKILLTSVRHSASFLGFLHWQIWFIYCKNTCFSDTDSACLVLIVWYATNTIKVSIPICVASPRLPKASRDPLDIICIFARERRAPFEKLYVQNF